MTAFYVTTRNENMEQPVASDFEKQTRRRVHVHRWPTASWESQERHVMFDADVAVTSEVVFARSSQAAISCRFRRSSRAECYFLPPALMTRYIRAWFRTW
ncbi:hypothetical protein PILCRDRAFT_583037 [Piloderma croceum F 1598]|uniref:Uncharacterized protein n=1 Tax=Piloderma croceum (strain F 1598) TaxID=765440 RepID=A0A0C3FFG2_PILCF|nr:hypothetical protein PILCRDRAFT_583037 [Piloderma croceum F 1598]